MNRLLGMYGHDMQQSLNFPESDILFCIKCTVNVHLNYSKTDEALEYLVV